jgi:hypothetical protein
MKGKLYRTAIVIVALCAVFMSLPLLGNAYSYMTFQHNSAQVILKDGTEIAGSIKFHSFRCDNYEIKNKNGIHVVPKNSVRELKIQLEAVNIR